MTAVNSFKFLERAIMDGLNIVKVENPKLLVACAVAEGCKGIPNHISSYLDLLFNQQRRNTRDSSNLYIPYLNEDGKVQQICLTISLCADALKVISILKRNSVSLQVTRNSEGIMTEDVQIVRAVS